MDKGHNPLAVANYFIEQSDDRLTCTKLIKLVYIAHGYTLAITNQPLVNEYALAWKYGPVFPSIYHEFKKLSQITKSQKAREFDDMGENLRECQSDFTENEMAIMDFILNKYGNMAAWELSALTHVEGSPWSQTIEKSNEIEGMSIDNEMIKTYYLKFKKQAE